MYLISGKTSFVKRNNIILNSDENKYHIDFEWAFNFNRISLSLIGVWPEETDSKYLRIPIMVILMLASIFFPSIYALTKVYKDLTLAIDNLIVNCSVFVGATKLIILWNNKQVLKPIIRAATENWSRKRSHWELRIMEKQAQRARLFTLSGYVLIFFCFVGFIAPPFLGFSIRVVNNITDDLITNRYLPLQTFYPYTYNESPYFELTYISQIVAGGFAAFATSVPDNFFSALIFHACAQCEILGEEMKEILPIGLHGDVTKWIENGKSLLQMKVRNCVRTHVDLIRYITAVEKTFNLLILVQVLYISSIICCLGFTVIRSLQVQIEQPPVAQIITLSGTLASLLIHMLVYCIACEILANHSFGFRYSIYCSNWYLLPNTYARDIILIMTQSKTPLRLSAGKFFYLSLAKYLSILKTSAGYISVLLTVSK